MKRGHAVLLLAAALFFWNLWGTDLWAPDEPYFGEGAREMVVDGQWAVPHVNGVVTTDKPPLFFWLIALFSAPFGAVSSFTARLPSALAGLGTVALTMRLATRMGSGVPGVSVPAAGWLAGLLVTTNYMVWEKARSSQIDALLCFLILVAISALHAHRSGAASGRRTGLLFWAAMGLAVIAKGPVGLLLPLGVALATLLVDRNLRAWRRFAPLLGPLVFVAIVGGWMAIATIGGRGEYSVWGAFEEHALNRALHGLHHKQPPWYYLEMLPVQLLPWSGLIPGALVLAFRRRDADDRMLLVWALFIVAFFSISTEKRDLYVLPAYPAFLILAARFVLSLSAPEPLAGRRWFQLPHGFFALIVGLAGFALPILNQRSATLPGAVAIALAVPLAVAGLAGGIAALRGKVRPSLSILVVGTACAYLVLATVVYPAMNPVKSARALARSVREHTAAARAQGEPVVAYRLGNLPEAIAFYSDGVYTQETSDVAAVAAHLAQSGSRFLIVDAEVVASLPPELRGQLRVVDTARLARRTIHLIEGGAR